MGLILESGCEDISVIQPVGSASGFWAACPGICGTHLSTPFAAFWWATCADSPCHFSSCYARFFNH